MANTPKQVNDWREDWQKSAVSFNRVNDLISKETLAAATKAEANQPPKSIEPQTFLPERALSEFGVKLEPNWKFNIFPDDKADQGIGYSFLSPDLWEVFPNETYKSPEGKLFTKTELEGYQNSIAQPSTPSEPNYMGVVNSVYDESTGELYTAEQLRSVLTMDNPPGYITSAIEDAKKLGGELVGTVTSTDFAFLGEGEFDFLADRLAYFNYQKITTAFNDVFDEGANPDFPYNADNTLKWIGESEENMDYFQELVRLKGRSDNTESLITSLYPTITGKQLDQFFAPVQFKDVMAELFPDRNFKELLQSLQTEDGAAQELLGDIYKIGRNDNTVTVLYNLGFEDSDVQKFFTDLRFVDESHRVVSKLNEQLTPEAKEILLGMGTSVDEMRSWAIANPDEFKAEMTKLPREDANTAMRSIGMIWESIDRVIGVPELSLRQTANNAFLHGIPSGTGLIAGGIELWLREHPDESQEVTFDRGLLQGTGEFLIEKFENALNVIGIREEHYKPFTDPGMDRKRVGEVAEDIENLYSPANIRPIENVSFSKESLFNGEFIATTLASSIPIQLVFFAAAAAAMAVASTGVGAIGLTGFAATAATSACGGVASRYIESYVEAAGAVEEAITKGYSQEEADAMAMTVFNNNMKLAGLDAAQFFVMLATPGGGGGVINTITRAALSTPSKLVAEVISEGAEEWAQEAFVVDALGEDFDWNSPRMVDSAVAGLMMGLIPGGVGAVVNFMKKVSINSLSKADVDMYIKIKNETLAKGKSKGIAEQIALDTVIAYSSEAKAAVEEALSNVGDAARKVTSQDDVNGDLSIPDFKKTTEDAIQSNWIKGAVNALSHLPFGRGLSELIDPRITIDPDKMSVDHIVKRNSVGFLAFIKMGIDVSKVWSNTLKGISVNPMKLFGFDDFSISKKMKGRLLSQYKGDFGAGSFEHIFTQPEQYDWTGFNKGKRYAYAIRNMYQELSQLADKAGVERAKVDHYLHRVVLGKYNSKGRLVPVRGAPGKTGKGAASRSIQRGRSVKSIRAGIGNGPKTTGSILYDLNPISGLESYVQEIYTAIGQKGFIETIESELASIDEGGITLDQYIKEKFPKRYKDTNDKQQMLFRARKFTEDISTMIRTDGTPDKIDIAEYREWFTDWGDDWTGWIDEYERIAHIAPQKQAELFDALNVLSNEIETLKAEAKPTTAQDVETVKRSFGDLPIKATDSELKSMFREMDRSGRVVLSAEISNLQADNLDYGDRNLFYLKEGYETTLNNDPAAKWENTITYGVRNVKVKGKDVIDPDTGKPKTRTISKTFTLTSFCDEYGVVPIHITPFKAEVIGGKKLSEWADNAKVEEKGKTKIKFDTAADKVSKGLGFDRAEDLRAHIEEIWKAEQSLGSIDAMSTELSAEKIHLDRMAKLLRNVGVEVDNLEQFGSYEDDMESFLPQQEVEDVPNRLDDNYELQQDISATLEPITEDEYKRIGDKVATHVEPEIEGVEDLKASDIPDHVDNLTDFLLVQLGYRRFGMLQSLAMGKKLSSTARSFREAERNREVFKTLTKEVAHLYDWRSDPGIVNYLKDALEALSVDDYYTEAKMLESALVRLLQRIHNPGIVLPEAPVRKGTNHYKIKYDITPEAINSITTNGRGDALRSLHYEVTRAIEGTKRSFDWQMPGEVYNKLYKWKGKDHKAIVEEALIEGLPVPQDVIDEYPMLAERYPNSAGNEDIYTETIGLRRENAINKVWYEKQIARASVSPLGYGRLFQSHFNGKLYAQETVDLVNKFFGHKEGLPALDFAVDVAGILRVTKVSMDISFPAIQGIPAFGLASKMMITNPALGRRMMGAVLKSYIVPITAYFNPEWMHRYIDKNRHAALERIYAGGSRTSVDWFDALHAVEGLGGGAAKLLAMIPGQPLSRSELAFHSSGEIIRNTFWELMSEDAKSKGQTHNLATFLDRLTGQFDSASIGVTSRWSKFENAFVWFAPRYTRACMALISNVFRGGYTGAMARSAMGGMVGAGIIGYAGAQMAISLAAGKDEDEALKDVMEGFGLHKDTLTGKVEWSPSAEFMSMQIGNYNFGFGGFWYGMVRLIGDIMATVNEIGDKEHIDFVRIMKDGNINRNNPFVYGWYKRSSPSITTANDLIQRQEFFTGRPIETKEDYLKYIATRFEPIVMEQGLNWLIPGAVPEDDIPQGKARFVLPIAEAVGLRTNPKSKWTDFYEAADKIAMKIPEEMLDDKQMQAFRDGILEWKSLSELQQSYLREQFTELSELELQAKDFMKMWNSPNRIAWQFSIEAARDDYNNSRDTGENQLVAGEKSTKEYREIVSHAGELFGYAHHVIETDTRNEEIYTLFDKYEEERNEYGLRDIAALIDYQAIIYDETMVKENGDYDWDARDKRIAGFIDKYDKGTLDIVIQHLVRKKVEGGASDLAIQLYLDKENFNEEYWKLPYQSIYKMDETDAENNEIPPEQYKDWMLYNSLTTKAEKETFLETHAELSRDYRAEFRAIHPEIDGAIAFWGYGGKLQSIEAYDHAVKLGEKYGVSIESMGIGLPPREVLGAYFDYNEIVKDNGGTSRTAKLFRVENIGFNEWGQSEAGYGWKPVEESKAELHLYTDWVAEDEAYDDILAEYSDDTVTQSAKTKEYLESNPDYSIARRLRGAYSIDLDEDLFDSYLDYHSYPESGYRRTRERLENEELNVALIEAGKAEPLSYTSLSEIPSVEYDDIREQWADSFKGFDDIKGMDETARNKRRNYLLKNSDFAEAKIRSEGLKGLYQHIDEYVEYYQLSEKGYWRDRYLSNHLGLYDEMLNHELQPIRVDLIKPEAYDQTKIDFDNEYTEYEEIKGNTVEARLKRDQYMTIHPKFEKSYYTVKAYDDKIPEAYVSNYVEFMQKDSSTEKDLYLVENTDFHAALTLATDTYKTPLKDIESLRISVKWAKEDNLYDKMSKDDKADMLLKNTEYRNARNKRAAYDKGFAAKYIRNYIEYYAEPTTFSQQRYLKEHRDFYDTAKELLGWTSVMDWNRVPSSEVESMISRYDGLPTNDPEKANMRCGSQEFDNWLVTYRKVTPAYGTWRCTGGSRPKGPTQAEKSQDALDRLGDLRNIIDRETKLHNT